MSSVLHRAQSWEWDTNAVCYFSEFHRDTNSAYLALLLEAFNAIKLLIVSILYKYVYLMLNRLVHDLAVSVQMQTQN